jgi:hypothetical protein
MGNWELLGILQVWAEKEESIDVRENIIKKNPELVKLIETPYGESRLSYSVTDQTEKMQKGGKSAISPGDIDTISPFEEELYRAKFLMDEGHQFKDVLLPALNSLHSEHGSPIINRHQKKIRANYTAGSNTMNVGSRGFIEDWAAELSHAKQFNTDKTGQDLAHMQDIELFKILSETEPKEYKKLERAAKRKNKIDPKDYESLAEETFMEFKDSKKYKQYKDEYAYNTPGMLEYDAHQNIQPQILTDAAGRIMKGVWAKHTTPDIEERPMRGVSKKQKGGKSELGYADNSPYKNEPSITIDSNTIDMSKTSKPLMAYPNIGTPKLMKPKSGTHIFPEATHVVEVPLLGKGGKKKKKIPFYQEGGQPVPTGVQMEEDEIIVTPNLDILDSAARDPHKEMKKDDVTDIMRPEDYVLSHKLKLTKKEAEKMSLGYGAMLYREGEVPKMPVEKTIADMFKENEKDMTLAEFGKRVRKKLPITDKEDVFSLKTNDANRAARLPYIAAAVHKNEMKRTKGKPEFEYESMFENPFEGSFGSNSGQREEGMSVMGGIGSVPEMQDGGPFNPLDFIGEAINIGTGLFDAFIGAPKRKKQALHALEADDIAIDKLAATQGKFANSATGAALAGYAMQDPTVNAPQYDSTQIDARVRRAPKSMWEYAMGKAIAGSRPFQQSLFNNSGSFSQAANAFAPVHGSNVGMLADIGAREAQMNIGLENQYRDMKQGFNDRQTLSDTTAKNATRTNRNALVAGTASTLSGGITTQGTIESNRQNALRSNDLQKAQAKINASQQGVQAAYGIGTTAMMLPDGMFNKVQPLNNNLPYIAPPQPYTGPTQLQGFPQMPLNPIAPYGPAPYQSGVPINQQGSPVPLGPNSTYDPSTGLWFG